MENNTKKRSGGGFLGGLALIVIGIMLLSFNEGRTVSMQSAINEAMSSYKDVSSETIDPKNDGTLIATNGKLDLSNSSELNDSKFGITIKGAKLKRNVEMYQWVEECTTDDNDNKTCTYDKKWSDEIIDSSEFTKSGYNNPTSFKYEGKEYFATNVKVGAFDLPERLLNSLSYNKNLSNEELTDMYKNTVEGFKVEENYITNTKVAEEYQIGDIRISYSYASDGEVTMLGIQTGNTLTAFTGKKGKSIFTIKRGVYTGKELLTGMATANKHTKWLLRAVGTLVVVIGVGSLFSPLQMLADKIPVVRNIVGMSTSLVSIVLGLTISLVVIAISWFRYRPVLSIALIAIGVCLLLFLKLKKKKEPEKKVESSDKKN